MARARRNGATPAVAFGRGGVDETLMGHPQTDVYRSTGDEAMVKKPRAGDAEMELRKRPVPGAIKSLKRGGTAKKTGAYKLHKGEKVVPAKKNKVREVMHEFKAGKLHSGSKKGPQVTSRKQAIAIGLNQARKAKR